MNKKKKPKTEESFKVIKMDQLENPLTTITIDLTNTPLSERPKLKVLDVVNYDNDGKEKYERLKLEAVKIGDMAERLKFWMEAENDHRHEMSWQDLNVSGSPDFPYPGDSGFVKHARTEINFIKEQLQEKPVNKFPPVGSLDDLFYDPRLISPCIELLKHIDPPAITADGKPIFKPKGVIVVWLQELTEIDILKPIEYIHYPALISKKFPDFKIDKSMFGANKAGTKAEDCRQQIRSAIKKVKALLGQ